MSTDRWSAGWLATLRIYTGAFWLIHGVQKIASGAFAGDRGAMAQIVTQFASKTSGPYHHFLTGTVLTHAATFGQLVQWGETLCGLSLDAYYARLDGLTRDELRYILDPADVYGSDYPSETFRVLKEREIRELGGYRTARLVLDAWDRLNANREIASWQVVPR